HCTVDRPFGHIRDFINAYATIRLHYAGAQRYLITSFIDASVRYHPAKLVPPVLRPMVYEQNATAGDCLVAYAGACGSIDRFRAALESLTGMPVYAYGFGITGQVGRVTYKPTSAEGFLSDLAACAAVIATAGHTLVSECLHLAKPMLLMPIAHQFEQVLNAHYVEKIGVGRHVRDIDSATIASFTRELDCYHKALRRRPKARLDHVLDAVEAELRLPA
ncbi:MAG: glycosyltransferase family protein, partial [Planctomycetota bacterium]